MATTTTTSSPRRLDFTAIQHCGRREELKLLLDYVKQPDAHDQRPASLWIEAEPGVGKSNLLQQFREVISTNNTTTTTTTTTTDGDHHGSCICIQGKFEERAAASEPFAALSEAMGELVGILLQDSKSSSASSDSLSPSWSQSIQKTLDTEWPLLADILPILRPLVQEDDARTNEPPEKADQDLEDEDAFGDFSAKEWRFERFRLAFRALIRHVCHRLQVTKQQQLVLILDDLHWICPDSLQILKTLLKDRRRPDNFLLVVATRPLGLRQYEQLYKFRQNLLENQSQGPTNDDNNRQLVRVLPVTRLSVSEIKDLLLELLQYQTQDDNKKEQQQHQQQSQQQEQGDTATLQQLQGEREEEVTELAQIVKSKTKGNFFVLLQFLRLLERAGHIYFHTNEQYSCWRFDIAAIHNMQPISENVSEVVAHNLVETVQGRRRSALMVAASFGVSQFDVSTIVHAVSVLEEHQSGTEEEEEQEQEDNNENDNDNDDNNSYFLEDSDDPYVVHQRMNDMSMELSGAAGEGFVEETSPGHYRFCHDRIRESAYSLLPPGDSRSEIHLKVGRQLRSWMDTSSELGLWQRGFSKESLLLHAAKQSNLGADLIQDEWELLELAELNFQAAELAARKAAFFSSMEYLQVGLSHLGATVEEAWNKHYDLALKFTIALTRMQYSCGLLEECWATSIAVIQHGKTFPDKARIYHTRLLCLTQQERHDEALDLALQVFDMLGKPWPRRYVMFHAFREYLKVGRFLNKTKDEELLNLPIKDDENLLLYVDFLEKVGEIAWLGGNLGYLLLYICRSVWLIAEGDNYNRSFYSIVGWASIKANFGDYAAGYHYGQLAKAMAEKQRSSVPHLIARLDLTRGGFINLWQQEGSFRTDLESLVEASRQFWVHGLVDVALVDFSGLVQHLFVAGEPLRRIAFECDRYSEAFVDYQQMMHWYINAPLCQAVLNLQGSTTQVAGNNNNNPAILMGEHITQSEASFLDNCKKTANKAATFQYQFWSMYLGYHFGHYKLAKRFLKSMRSDLFEDGPGVLVINRLFYTGLVYFALYKETGKARYRRRAIQAQRQLERWLKKGVGCCDYMCQLLHAENHSCHCRGSSSSNGTTDRVLGAYDRAIQSVAEAGICHHHALAQELAGTFLFQRLQQQQQQQQQQRQQRDVAELNRRSSMLPMVKQYLSFAVQLYRDWGALAKVKDLQNRYSSLLELEGEESGTTTTITAATVGVGVGVGGVKPSASTLKGGRRVITRRETESETLEGSHLLGDSSSLRCQLLSSTTSRGSQIRIP